MVPFQGASGATPASAEAPSPSTEPPLEGTQVGHWRLERLLGEGAMGRVFAARHARIGRQAAVKVLKVEHAASPDVVRRFVQESQAVNAIRDEHLVDVYDFGEVEQPSGPALVYCVMELLEGEALSTTLDRGAVAVQRAASICMQLARALAAAHRVGVVHRDIKPENVFLVPRGDHDFVKVLDFGVAKVARPLGDEPLTGTLAGVVLGTPEYLSPEQASGGSVDWRADLYAVGLVLYELLTGAQPLQAHSFGELVREICHRPAPPLPLRSPLGEPIPRALAHLVARCLEKQPEARYQSGEELARALEPYALGTATEPGSFRAPPELLAAQLAAVRPSPWPMVLAAALALLVVGLVAAVAWSERPAAAAASEVSLDVASEPAGAQLSRGDTGEVLGRTPVSVRVHPGGATTLVLALDGYSTERREVDFSQAVRLSVELKPVHRQDARRKQR
jgi:serine/threonine protein kinase